MKCTTNAVEGKIYDKNSKKPTLKKRKYLIMPRLISNILSTDWTCTKFDPIIIYRAFSIFGE